MTIQHTACQSSGKVTDHKGSRVVACRRCGQILIRSLRAQ